ncbi:GNAT family N-acetyltransferase [Agromyces marinus]|uniref:N-acetyltransferase n=1 Tax=Agromyces marinus TaxID=1389020 RepID=A0ABM8H4S3_9MICO|nr:GNAT family N-acetyltransferase [Agromyces marinus]UIP59197.1 hypothetical protein DSM26151_20950 [Agromyces marinus]BDZ55804.1 N-acetyltransferase [Agromyces marinus]
MPAPDSTNDPGLVLRLMRADEAAAVGRLARDAYARAYELPDAYLDDIEAVGDRARSQEVWVAADAVTGELLGTVTTPRPAERLSSVARHEDELDFRFLAVSPAARGRRVGEAMVRHVFGLAASRGIRRVVLNTGAQMVPAQRLYERLGFQPLDDREFSFAREDGTLVRILAYGIDVPAAPAAGGAAA